MFHQFFNLHPNIVHNICVEEKIGFIYDPVAIVS